MNYKTDKPIHAVSTQQTLLKLDTNITELARAIANGTVLGWYDEKTLDEYKKAYKELSETKSNILTELGHFNSEIACAEKALKELPKIY